MPYHDETTARADFAAAIEERRDAWVAANGGTETPVRYSDGGWYLYVYNPALHEHGLYRFADDTVLVGPDAIAVMRGEWAAVMA